MQTACYRIIVTDVRLDAILMLLFSRMSLFVSQQTYQAVVNKQSNSELICYILVDQMASKQKQTSHHCQKNIL